MLLAAALREHKKAGMWNASESRISYALPQIQESVQIVADMILWLCVLIHGTWRVKGALKSLVTLSNVDS